MPSTPGWTYLIPNASSPLVLVITPHSTDATVEWGQVANAAQYLVEYKTSVSGAPGTTLFSQSVLATQTLSSSYNGLSQGTPYFVRNTPYDASGLAMIDSASIWTAFTTTVSIVQPDSISDLWAWYESDHGTATSWTDLSSNGRHLVASTDSPNNIENPVIITSAINGLPAYSPNTGADKKAHLLTSQNIPDDATNGITIFIVGSQVIGTSNGTDSNGLFLASGSSILMYRGVSNSVSAKARGGSSFLNKSPVTDEAFYTIRLDYDSSFNRHQLAINGGSATYGTAGTNAFTPSPLEIFYSASFLGGTGNKKLAAILIYTRKLSDQEIGYVENYLRNKYQHY